MTGLFGIEAQIHHWAEIGVEAGLDQFFRHAVIALAGLGNGAALLHAKMTRCVGEPLTPG